MVGACAVVAVLLALVVAVLLPPGRGRWLGAGRAEPMCGSCGPLGGPGLYTPACGALSGGLARRACAGPTSGAMPAIDFEGGPLTAECCGRLGVPP